MNEGCAESIVDGYYHLHTLLPLDTESKIDWDFDVIWTPYIGSNDEKIVAPVETIKLSDIAEEAIKNEA